MPKVKSKTEKYWIDKFKNDEANLNWLSNQVIEDAWNNFEKFAIHRESFTIIKLTTKERLAI